MRIAVFCGASIGKNRIYEEVAAELGRWIGENSHELIYGGNSKGLMGAVALAAKKAGAEATGVMPRFLLGIEEKFEGLDKFILVESMDERKSLMITSSDACIALPGGAGTLEEISQAFSWLRLGKSGSPCIFYNKNSYYDDLMAMFDKMVVEGFLSEEDRAMLLFSDNLEEIGEFIKIFSQKN